jgi:hypothetical protein
LDERRPGDAEFVEGAPSRPQQKEAQRHADDHGHLSCSASAPPNSAKRGHADKNHERDLEPAGQPLPHIGKEDPGAERGGREHKERPCHGSHRHLVLEVRQSLLSNSRNV